MIPLPSGLATYAATALIAGAATFGGAWYWQGLRHESAIAERDRADAAAKVRYLENINTGLAAAISDNQLTGELYANLQKELATFRSQAMDRSKRAADLQRLLNNQCPRASAASVQSESARGSADAVAPEWRIDHFLKSP